jgi:hypothetical protein
MNDSIRAMRAEGSKGKARAKKFGKVSGEFPTSLKWLKRKKKSLRFGEGDCCSMLQRMEGE